MARATEKRKVHCPVKHVNAYIVHSEDGGHTVKCSLLKSCGDSCPYLADPYYKSAFKRAPGYRSG